MNPPSPNNPREQMEVRIVAFLLGEASPFETAEIEAALASDPQLAAFHDQMKRTIGLVQETTIKFKPAAQPAQPQPKLSPDRREKLLKTFKVIAPQELAPPPTPRFHWSVTLKIAAALVGLLALAALFLPALSRAKAKAMRLSEVTLGFRGTEESRSHWNFMSAKDSAPAAKSAEPPAPAAPIALSVTPPPLVNSPADASGQSYKFSPAASPKPARQPVFLPGQLADADGDGRKAAEFFGDAAAPVAAQSSLTEGRRGSSTLTVSGGALVANGTSATAPVPSDRWAEQSSASPARPLGTDAGTRGWALSSAQDDYVASRASGEKSLETQVSRRAAIATATTGERAPQSERFDLSSVTTLSGRATTVTVPDADYVVANPNNASGPAVANYFNDIGGANPRTGLPATPPPAAQPASGLGSGQQHAAYGLQPAKPAPADEFGTLKGFSFQDLAREGKAEVAGGDTANFAFQYSGALGRAERPSSGGVGGTIGGGGGAKAAGVTAGNTDLYAADGTVAYQQAAEAAARPLSMSEALFDRDGVVANAALGLVASKRGEVRSKFQSGEGLSGKPAETAVPTLGQVTALGSLFKQTQPQSAVTGPAPAEPALRKELAKAKELSRSQVSAGFAGNGRVDANGTAITAGTLVMDGAANRLVDSLASDDPIGGSAVNQIKSGSGTLALGSQPVTTWDVKENAQAAKDNLALGDTRQELLRRDAGLASARQDAVEFDQLARLEKGDKSTLQRGNETTAWFGRAGVKDKTETRERLLEEEVDAKAGAYSVNAGRFGNAVVAGKPFTGTISVDGTEQTWERKAAQELMEDSLKRMAAADQPVAVKKLPQIALPKGATEVASAGRSETELRFLAPQPSAGYRLKQKAEVEAKGRQSQFGAIPAADESGPAVDKKLAENLSSGVALTADPIVTTHELDDVAAKVGLENKETFEATRKRMGNLAANTAEGAKQPSVLDPVTLRRTASPRIEAQVQQVERAQLEKQIASEPASAPAPKPVPAAEPDRPALRPSTPPPTPQPEILTRENNFSTFSLNVSDVSFKLAEASLQNGALPDPGSIRVEEFLNAFHYRDPAPAPGARIGFAWERARYPFAHNRDILRLGVQTAARGREAQKPLNLVIALDNSGSMERPDRVAIQREALKVLAAQLRPQDRISVIAFSRTPRLWVDGMAGGNPQAFLSQVLDLNPEGGTNLEDAMNLAYATATKHFMAQGVNRVILLTDGAANLGNIEPEELKKTVVAQRQRGIALDCFGIGWEGYDDDLLETLSRNGDGRYGFLNSPEDAAPEFADQLAGALNVSASDVKTQVEFNPQRVTSWRQIGYAKHQLKKEQFRDNTVDAAEIAAAEQGNALYVIETNPNGTGPIGTVRVRFKVPETGEYVEQEWPLAYVPRVPALDQSSPAMRLAVTASAFGEWLSTSPFAAEVRLPALQATLVGVPQIFAPDPRPQRLATMIQQARTIAGK